ncbi:Ankyrin repeat protein [Rickettsiales bacterium Ac37b]|nr:Ankyrin repeat protein [Rickettsiales bacterium Ac37b]
MKNNSLDIEQNVNLKLLKKWGMTPLHYAVAAKDRARVELLLTRENNIGVEENSMINFLPIALKNFYMKIKKKLGINNQIEVRDKLGRTALHIATEHGYLEIAELLINKGANINARDPYGKTPLCIAVEKNEREVMKLLIDKGANIDAEVNNITNSLYAEIKKFYIKTKKRVINRGNYVEFIHSRRSPLHYAIAHTEEAAMKLLLENGAEIDILDKNGETPLYYASKSYRYAGDKMKILVATGAKLTNEIKEEISDDLYKELKRLAAKYQKGNKSMHETFSGLLALMPAATCHGIFLGKDVMSKIAHYMTSEEVSNTVTQDTVEAATLVYNNRQASEHSVATIENIIKSGKANLYTIMNQGKQRSHMIQYSKLS